MSYTFTIRNDFETLLDITISKDVLFSEKSIIYSLLSRLFESVFQNIKMKQKDDDLLESTEEDYE